MPSRCKTEKFQRRMRLVGSLTSAIAMHDEVLIVADCHEETVQWKIAFGRVAPLFAASVTRIYYGMRLTADNGSAL